MTASDVSHKKQSTIPADSPIRRLYLLALIDATKHPQIHGHPTICQTAAQIATELTKECLEVLRECAAAR